MPRTIARLAVHYTIMTVSLYTSVDRHTFPRGNDTRNYSNYYYYYYCFFTLESVLRVSRGILKLRFLEACKRFGLAVKCGRNDGENASKVFENRYQSKM